MQPDSIRPAASMPSLTFSDDIAHFQSKVLHSRANIAPENATIQLIALSSKLATVPELRYLSRIAARSLCLFCRKSCRFRLFFSPVRPQRPIYRHGVAAPTPQIWSGG